jgi:hypothetical protein
VMLDAMTALGKACAKSPADAKTAYAAALSSLNIYLEVRPPDGPTCCDAVGMSWVYRGGASWVMCALFSQGVELPLTGNERYKE